MNDNQRQRSAEELYREIMDMPHHVSPLRPPMPMSQRAAQFAPFAALNGYEDAIAETGRLTSGRIELSDCEARELNRRILVAAHSHVRVRITYFAPDERKEGGRYVSVSGAIRRIDPAGRELLLTDGRRIPLKDIQSLVMPSPVRR